jgi:tetratricopeptide (TPR) repeat protein
MSPYSRLALVLPMAALLACAPGTPPAFAAGSIVEPAKTDSDYDKAVKAVKAEKYRDAIELLQKVVQKEPAKADAWNYLGYSQRKTGMFEDALKSYTRALEIDPRHRGAHEYVGELYLQTDNLPKAEEHLKKLIEICGNCSEKKDLEKAVAAYKKAKGLS